MISPQVWRGRRVLVTGSTGFKGAWLCLWLRRLGASVTGLALPPENRLGAFSALAPWMGLAERTVDLRDAAAVIEAVRSSDPEVVLHLAAQALVPRGYADPVATYAVNVGGTLALLDALRDAPSLRAVVIVTSDKVYRNDGAGSVFREDDPLGGHDPYSSSKACVELLVEGLRNAWHGQVAWRMATARAGNVIGGGDRAADRLVPDVVRAIESGTAVGLRHPESVRPWQHVLEPLSGYLRLAERLFDGCPGEHFAFNFGPAVDVPAVPVCEVVDRLLSLWGKGRWEPVPTSTGAEMSTLRLDPSRAAGDLGWRPVLDLDTALRWTVEWHRAQWAGRDLRALSIDQIAAYESLADTLSRG